jgi:hypothetical protein
VLIEEIGLKSQEAKEVGLAVEEAVRLASEMIATTKKVDDKSRVILENAGEAYDKFEVNPELTPLRAPLKHWRAMSQEWFTNAWDWLQNSGTLYSLGIMAAAVVAGFVVDTFFKRVLLRLSKKTKTDLDDKAVSHFKRPIQLTVLLMGLSLALVPLEMEEHWPKPHPGYGAVHPAHSLGGGAPAHHQGGAHPAGKNGARMW